jgi:hypothetical protein
MLQNQANFRRTETGEELYIGPKLFGVPHDWLTGCFFGRTNTFQIMNQVQGVVNFIGG